MSRAVAEDVAGKLRDAIREAYGIDADLSRLPGENLNFLVITEEGCRFVAKIAGDQQPPEFVALERAALEHATAVNPGLKLPLIRENKFGHYETLISVSEENSIRLRIIEFISGIPWSEIIDISDDLRFDLGRYLASFDSVMRSFEHPMAHRTHRWDLTRLQQHRDLIDLAPERDQRALLHWAIDQWAKFVSPVLGALPAQFIHGDPNPENILVEGDHIAGLIDFGDCCWNPPICELAICLAYQLMDHDDPWAAAAPIIAGYQEVLPLSDAERAILPALICGRLANTLCVAAERLVRDPHHPNWFVSVAPAWRLLEELHSRSGHKV